MKILFLSIFLLGIVFESVAQSNEPVAIVCKVEDAKTGEALIGAQVIARMGKKGTVTDIDGFFQLKVAERDTLEVSYLGYKARLVPVVQHRKVIALEAEAVLLDEFVFTAHANINDIDLRATAGAIATVEMENITERPAVNFMESLQGQVPGLVVINNGELGSAPVIRIRGTSTLAVKTAGVSEEDKNSLDNQANQPLFVLDGQIISPQAFASLNVNDIESIKVLKDAAANALYGIKAANGVIEITGKKGINGPTQYSYSVQSGVTMRGKPGVTMMGSEEKLEFERRAQNMNAPGYYLSEEYYRKYYASDPDLEQLILSGEAQLDSLRRINTDWFRQLTRMSNYQSHNIGVRGGNKSTLFYFSGNYSQQGGKFEGNNIQRFTSRLNLEYKIKDNLSVTMAASGGYAQNETPNGSNANPAQLVYQLNPYERPSADATLISFPAMTYADLVNQYSREAADKRFDFSASLFWQISPELQFSAIGGLDQLLSESLAITPPTAYSERTSGAPEAERGKAVKSKTTNANYSTNARLNFVKQVTSHLFTVSGNVDYYYQDEDFIGISGYGLPSRLRSGAGINQSIEGARRARTSSSHYTQAQLGFGLSAGYTFSDKYDVYLSYKTDGSSLMPPSKRWNTFWAAGLGYTLSNEGFWAENKVIADVKLRASYGITASLAGIDASLAVPTFTYGTESYLGYRSFYLKNLYNEALRPEKNESLNLGLDLNVLKKIDVKLDWYRRVTSDVLITVPIAPSNGFTSLLQNVGTVQNSGLECSISAKVIATKNFFWNAGLNVTRNTNKVLDLYDGDALYLSGMPYPDYKEGYAVDVLYGLRSLGIHPADGLPRFLNAADEEVSVYAALAEEDFVALGHSTPPITGLFFNRFSYKSLQVNFDFYFVKGGVAAYRNTSVIKYADQAIQNGVSGQLEDTWFAPGDEGKIYSKLNVASGEIYLNQTYATDKTTGKTDYIRLTNVRVSYNLTQWLKRSWTQGVVKSCSLSVQGKNLVTFSGFGDADPESASLVGSTQPVLTLGLNLTL